jgi:hypothetical protein
VPAPPPNRSYISIIGQFVRWAQTVLSLALQGKPAASEPRGQASSILDFVGLIYWRKARRQKKLREQNRGGSFCSRSE